MCEPKAPSAATKQAALAKILWTYALAEELDTFEPKLPQDADQMTKMKTGQGMALLREGKRLITYVSGARVPMPKSTEQYVAKCGQYQVPGKKN